MECYASSISIFSIFLVYLRGAFASIFSGGQPSESDYSSFEGASKDLTSINFRSSVWYDSSSPRDVPSSQVSLQVRQRTGLTLNPCANPENIHSREILGRGEFGIVYLVTLKDDHEATAIYALKEVTPQITKNDGVQEESTEEYLALSLTSPFVVRGLCAYTDGASYLMMDYIGRKNIEEVVAKGRISLKTILDWTENILEGLSAIHKAGFVHSDIRPENILINANAEAVIIDLGLAREYPFIGTKINLNFAAPELFLNKTERDQAVDFWALAVTLYKLVVNAYPFTRNRDIKNGTLIVGDEYFKFPPITQKNLRKGLKMDDERTLNQLNDIISRLGVVDPQKRKDLVRNYIIRDRGSIEN